MVIKDSIYTKILNSLDLTEHKYSEIMNCAVNIRDVKNEVSKFVHSNITDFLDDGKDLFVKKMRSIFYGRIDSAFDYQAYSQIYTCYENRFKQIQKSIVFESKVCEGVIYYKKKGKKKGKIHKKGDFKSFEIVKHKSMVCIALTYLERYARENTYEYIKEKASDETLEENLITYYKELLRVFDKFGYDRLLSLALSKRQRLLSKYNEKVIEFTSLTFGGRSRKKDILVKNKNKHSSLDNFILLSGFENYDTMAIPVSYSRHWHGSLKDLNRNKSNHEYEITFDEYNKSLKCHLTIKKDRYIPTVDDDYSNIYGGDVNVKHNLLCLSDGTTFDFNRKLVQDCINLLKVVDERKEKNKDYVPGAKLQHKIDTMKNKIKKNIQEVIYSVCIYLKLKNCHHIVLENLNNSFGKTYVKKSVIENEDAINFNRITSLLNLSSIKDEFIHIARKYDIGVSLVHPEYTSKMCSECGCIDDKNRQVQEIFDCVECPHSMNADLNAAINIKNRVCVTVLRDNLLKQTDSGTFEPIPMKRESVKNVPELFRKC